MSSIVELFGRSTWQQGADWRSVIAEQQCLYLGKRCYKVRKSDARTSIGTCTALFGKEQRPIMICPTRLLERKQIFTDCLHLLTMHEPGNELHIVPEVSIPGGSVDFVLASARDGRVKDFVGIELQTMDTTGSIWPERQRRLKELGVPRSDDAENDYKPVGINWKHTAKTILMQMHHKVQTFEHLNRKLVLVMQDHLLNYMSGEFRFGHLHNPAVLGDSMHFHAYRMDQQEDRSFKLALDRRLSTDEAGIAEALGLQAEARIEFEQIVAVIEAKMKVLNTLLQVA
ncbi:NotI family restriction endonuclease [Variovorax sp. V116]|uniref:NotI family restriction endonuclease n=1 Tax=Variovorax sp. V116 TaxID=3065953 RepID=UPI0034E8714B